MATTVNFRTVLGTAAIAATCILTLSAAAVVLEGQNTSPAKPPVVAATPHQSPYKPQRFTKRAEMTYEMVWGIDKLVVKYAESGELIRFSYRVLDADKAKPLHDKKLEPTLIDERAGVKLVVPSLEKVGQLRQSGTPVAGNSYWMAFSNKGRPVKRGDRVNIVIGGFHANGLIVD